LSMPLSSSANVGCRLGVSLTMPLFIALVLGLEGSIEEGSMADRTVAVTV